MAYTDNLTSCWELEETSGTRNDAVVASANNLTDNNTVTQQTGKVGNCAQFTRANSEYLSKADNALLSLGADSPFMLCAAVYADSFSAGGADGKGSNNIIVAKWDSSAGQREYFLDYDSASARFRFAVRGADDSTNGIVSANTFGAPGTGTWYYLMGWHDPVANKVFISVNNGTADEVAFSAGTRNGTATFYIGATDFGVGIQNFWDGRIDQVLFYNGGFQDATGRTGLYNSGNLLSYAAMVGTTVGPKATHHRNLLAV